MSEFRRRLMMAQGGKKGIPNYLCFTALENGTFTLTIPLDLPNNVYNYVEYSVDDGSSWIRTNNIDSTQIVVTTPTIPVNNNVLWRGVGSTLGSNSYSYSHFSSTGRFDASGCIQSLYHLDDVNNTTIAKYKYAQLFYNCKTIINAKDLIIPSSTLDNICLSMFRGCTNLLTAPVLSALVMVANCYREMYAECTSLIKIINFATSRYSTNAYYNWMRNVPTTAKLIANIDASDTFISDMNNRQLMVVLYNTSTKKYYLSDRITECDEDGNPL